MNSQQEQLVDLCDDIPVSIALLVLLQCRSCCLVTSVTMSELYIVSYATMLELSFRFVSSAISS